MSVTILSYPTKVVNGNPAQVSRWNSVHQPIQFKLSRKDSVIQSLTRFDVSEITIQVFGYAEGIVGDTVYFSSGAITGTGTISNIIASTPVFSLIRVYFYTPITTTQLGGYINWVSARVNYYVETIVYGVDNIPAYFSLGSSINKPSTEGVLTVDVSTFLKPLVDYIDTYDYSTLNLRDQTRGGLFNLQYREIWEGVEGTWSGIDDKNVFYYVNSAKQIQQLYGTNMADYVPFMFATPTETMAKFMSDFEKPTFFKGFPFSMTFIYSETVAGHNISKYENVYSVNHDLIGSSVYLLDAAQSSAVNRFILDSDTYTCDSKEIEVWLEAEGTSTMPFVTTGYVTTGYVASPTPPLPVDTEITK